MLRSTNDVKIIRNRKEEAIGIDLGWAFKIQHEYGHDGLDRIFGLNNSLPSYHAYKMNKKFADFEIYLHFSEGNCQINKEKRKWARLIVADPYKTGEILNEKVQKPILNENIVAIWEQDSMAIYAWDKESISLLKEINDKLKTGNIFLANSYKESGWPTCNGLSITIASMWDQDYLDKIHHEYIDKKELEKTAKETGIYQKLEKANLKFYALSPAWTKKILDHSNKTKHDVVFFLNPQKQAKYNSGWFTVEELIEWTEGKGPIVKKP